MLPFLTPRAIWRCPKNQTSGVSVFVPDLRSSALLEVGQGLQDLLRIPSLLFTCWGQTLLHGHSRCLSLRARRSLMARCLAVRLIFARLGRIQAQASVTARGNWVHLPTAQTACSIISGILKKCRHWQACLGHLPSKIASTYTYY